ncbi:MAG: ABC transporter permease [Gemmiger sp.]
MFFKYNAKSKLYKVMMWVLPVASLVALLGLYLLSVQTNPLVLPSLPQIYKSFLRLITTPIKGATIWTHIGISLLRVMIGASASWVFGIAFGVLIGWNKTLDATIGTLFTIIRPIPPVAWIPLIILLCGIGEFPKYLLVFIACSFGVISQTYAGIKLVETQAVDVGKIFGANQFEILIHIVLPAAMSSIFVGIYDSIGNGWKVDLAAEMMGATLGIGALVMRAWGEMDMAMVIVCIIMIGITGALISFAMKQLERLLTPWNR